MQLGGDIAFLLVNHRLESVALVLILQLESLDHYWD
jgi:hypothetical protein